MKQIISLIVVALCCLLGPGHAAPQPPADVLRFPANGFSIAPFEDVGKGLILAMNLPVSEGFAPNVNVIRQPFNDSLDAYVAQTVKQFEQVKFTVVKNDKVDDHTVVLEYSGSANNRRIHSYEKIVWTPDHLMLAAATCTAAQWDQMSEKLRACVDSFQLEKAKEK